MNTSRLALSAMASMRGGDVGVAVVNLPVLAARGRADDRREAAPDGFLQRRDVDLDDFADVTDVNFLARIFLVVQPEFAAFENVPPGKADRPGRRAP